MGPGAFWGTRVMEIVKKHDSGGLVWKRIKLTTTRKANAKKRLLRVWQENLNWCQLVQYQRWKLWLKYLDAKCPRFVTKKDALWRQVVDKKYGTRWGG
uniref:Uncharacterized protein n=1 Tax=Quercus lobata TaxID=97700 RepID=A0A7N2L9Z6_QUELO